MRARMSSQIFWSSASIFATYSFAYDACCSLSCFLCCVQFVPLCQQSQLQTGLPSEPSQPSRSQPPSHVFRSSESFSAIDLASSAICNCLLSLLLFLCHALPHRQVLCCCSSSDFLTVCTWFSQLGCFLLLNFNLRSNLNLVFSCFLGNLQFMFCCHASMTFSIFVSRHRSNFFLQETLFSSYVLGLQLALLFLFF